MRSGRAGAAPWVTERQQLPSCVFRGLGGHMSLGLNYLGAWGGAEVGIPGVSAGPAIVPVFL